MNLRRIRLLCIEIYKTINSLNPDFMKNIFEMKTNNRIVREKYKLNLNIPRTNQVTFGTNSLMILRFGTLYLLIQRQLKTLALLKI